MVSKCYTDLASMGFVVSSFICTIVTNGTFNIKEFYKNFKGLKIYKHFLRVLALIICVLCLGIFTLATKYFKADSNVYVFFIIRNIIYK